MAAFRIFFLLLDRLVPSVALGIVALLANLYPDTALGVGHQYMGSLGLGIAEDTRLSQIPLSLRRLFRKDMSQSLFLVLDLSLCRKRVSLCRGFSRLHLWHIATSSCDISDLYGLALRFGA